MLKHPLPFKWIFNLIASMSLFQFIFFRFPRFDVVVDVEGCEEVEHGEAVEKTPEAKVVTPEADARVNHVDAKLLIKSIKTI